MKPLVFHNFVAEVYGQILKAAAQICSETGSNGQRFGLFFIRCRVGIVVLPGARGRLYFLVVFLLCIDRPVIGLLAEQFPPQ